MKLLNYALVALALSGTGCGSESTVSPQVLQISGTVRQTNGTAVAGAPVDAFIGSKQSTSTQSDPAGRFVIVVPANSETVTLRATEPPLPPGTVITGTISGRVSFGGRAGRITIDIVLNEYQPI